MKTTIKFMAICAIAFVGALWGLAFKNKRRELDDTHYI